MKPEKKFVTIIYIIYVVIIIAAGLVMYTMTRQPKQPVFTDYNCNNYTGDEQEMCIADEDMNNRILSTQTWDNAGM